ncbi:MAG: AEC family transporter [Deltaproteobacteria bacterium]|nr:MAG: AEC family transporter [Deltaproteobacteria bacterium]
MAVQLIKIFISIISPVFGMVLIGYFAGPRLQLQSRTLSRAAYFLFVPAFVFNIISQARGDIKAMGLMALFSVGVVLLTALAGAATARLMGRPAPVVAAFALIASFANVGNFGLPIIEFRLGIDAQVPATINFLVIVMAAFIVGVGAANLVRGGKLSAVFAVLKTPALLALPPAVFFAYTGVPVPLPLQRVISLLAGAMIPVMLVALGVQLAASDGLHLGKDVWIASGVRLLGGPLLAAGLAAVLGMSGIERATAVIQSGMPAAVLTSIIAIEYDLLPDFVTSAVLFSTIASVVTLTVLIAVI